MMSWVENNRWDCGYVLVLRRAVKLSFVSIFAMAKGSSSSQSNLLSTELHPFVRIRVTL